METKTRESYFKIHQHRVKFIEDLEIQGREGVLCPVCEEPFSGPDFKCPECNFLCDESCGLLDRNIRHPLHPDHPLELFMPFRYRFCDPCGKCCRRCLSFGCNECDFRLDIPCASRWQVKKNACDKHTFVPLVEHVQFICNFCGEEGKDNICICSVCQLMIHSKCTRFSHTIKIAEEKQEKEEREEENDEVCKLCSNEVNTNNATYFCQEYGYAVHLKCARTREIMEDRGEITKLLPIEYHDYVTHMIKDINRAVFKRSLAGMINHFSHEHELILNSEEVMDKKVCDGCIQLISVPFYTCTQCNFFLHSLSASLPTNATYGGVPRNFTLMTGDSCFFCNACTYEREVDEYLMDLQCFIMQCKILHEGHHFMLSLQFLLVHKMCNFSSRSYL